jgi:glycosyltransferase involved in cell wall biosynthesis
MPRFFLADPSLLSVSGHCWSYLRSLAQPVQKFGYEPVFLGNRAVDAPLREERSVWPLFQNWCDTRFGTADRTFARHHKAILTDLREITRIFSVNRSDVFFINTLRHWSMAAVVDWLERLQASQRPWVVLVLHFTAFPDPDAPSESLKFFQFAFQRIETSKVRDRILLMADSEELIDEYRGINNRLTFALAPIPHAPARRPIAPRTPCALNVGYVGEARENKGFHLLPYVVNCASRSRLADRIRFHIHAYSSEPHSPYHRQVLPRLVRPNVELYRDQLSDDEYEDLLSRLEIVLFPYTRDNYHAQTSGIFSEAMALGKTVIVPRGTWMARQAAQFGGGTAFSPEDPVDLWRQVARAVELHEHFAVDAKNRSERWKTFHNATNLVGKIFATLKRQPDVFHNCSAADGRPNSPLELAA